MTQQIQLAQVAENIYEIPRADDMRVPVRVYGSEALLEEMQTEGDLTLSQGRNVATLPGIQKFAVVLPDGHQGYGFPIGGVAAVDTETGVISPGGIGFDINCGVRLLRTPLTYSDVEGREEELVERLYQTIPCGLGKGGYLDTDMDDLRGILERGMEWMLEQGHATEADLEHCEENGQLAGDPKKVPAEAQNRGHNQVGSLGSGNHFLEIQRVVDIYDEETAEAFGLAEDRVVVMIHSGSRGLGHQTCTEFIRRFEKAFPDIADSLPDKQLIYAPLGEQVAEDYKGAMYAAANFAWANRQAMTQGVREVFEDLFDVSSEARSASGSRMQSGDEVELIYDVCHNVAKEERHRVDSREQTVLVHRKGATRAFPAGRPEVPKTYREVGQPVFIPGSMGTSSYVLCGGEKSLDRTFGSTAHGAGRVMSRTQAKKEYTANELQRTLREQGIYVRARSGGTLTEEAPGAYKDIDEVIRVSDALNIGTKVARTLPIANIKG